MIMSQRTKSSLSANRFWLAVRIALAYLEGAKHQVRVSWGDSLAGPFFCLSSASCLVFGFDSIFRAGCPPCVKLFNYRLRVPR